MEQRGCLIQFRDLLLTQEWKLLDELFHSWGEILWPEKWVLKNNKAECMRMADTLLPCNTESCLHSHCLALQHSPLLPRCCLLDPLVTPSVAWHLKYIVKVWKITSCLFFKMIYEVGKVGDVDARCPGWWGNEWGEKALTMCFSLSRAPPSAVRREGLRESRSQSDGLHHCDLDGITYSQ